MPERIGKLLIGTIAALAPLLPPAADASAEDWPQWLGPARNGKSAETGLLHRWPPAGPEVLWRHPLGEGYAGIAIAEGRAFTLYVKDGQEVAAAFDAVDGTPLWQRALAPEFRNSWGDGPRVTPTIDDGRLYTATANANFFALDTRDGSILWQYDLAEDFGGIRPDLGYSNAPLVYGDLVLVTSGGRSDNAVIALNKRTGERVWASHNDHPGYSSPKAVRISGQEQVVFFLGTAAAGIDPLSGRLLWTYPWRTSSYENVATPVFVAPDKIFLSSPHAEKEGSAVVQLAQDNGNWRARSVWKSNVMKNHFSTVVEHNGKLYGTDRAILKCIDAETGKQHWQTRGFGEGTLIFADGHLIVLGTRGRLGLVKALPGGYVESSSAQILRGKCYTPPSLSDGRLYVRNQSELVCLQLAAQATGRPESGDAK